MPGSNFAKHVRCAFIPVDPAVIFICGSGKTQQQLYILISICRLVCIVTDLEETAILLLLQHHHLRKHLRQQPWLRSTVTVVKQMEVARPDRVVREAVQILHQEQLQQFRYYVTELVLFFLRLLLHQWESSPQQPQVPPQQQQQQQQPQQHPHHHLQRLRRKQKQKPKQKRVQLDVLDEPVWLVMDSVLSMSTTSRTASRLRPLTRLDQR